MKYSITKYEDRYTLKINNATFYDIDEIIIKLIKFLSKENKELQQRIDKAIKYIEDNTKYYDAEYSETYKELCDIAGANDTRIHVIVGDKELLSILKGED